MRTTIEDMNIQTVTFHTTSLVNVIRPGELEIKYLKNNFGFSSLHLDDYLNKTQIPKIEMFKNYTLVVLDFPFLSGGANGQQANGRVHFPPVSLPSFSQIEKRRRLVSSQVDFFIGKDYVVILHDGNLAPIGDLFIYCQKTLRHREEVMGEGPIFLAYKIIDSLVDMSFLVSSELSATIEKIDKELEKKPSQKTLEDISTTRRNVVVFHTMTKPILSLFKQLEQGIHKQLNGRMQPFWGNVGDHLQKIMDRIEYSRELIEGISESNESLLSYRNNELVKFFTIITSISFPFIIVNNLYSMNIVGLPYAQNHFIVWILFGVIFVSGLGIMIYFKFRKWL